MINTEIHQSADFWRKNLGLLPVPLRASSTNKFVMLNGLNGNFCIDFSDSQESDEPRLIAWTCNTDHYIQHCDDKLQIYSVGSNSFRPERFPTQKVVENLENFHQYLSRHTGNYHSSVVKHYLRVFRTLREVLGIDYTGEQALSTYTALISCAAQQSSINELDTERWGIGDRAIEISNSIRQYDWEALVEQIQTGYPNKSSNSYVDLVIRHSAGLIFQEAHFEATYIDATQMRIEGFLPTGVTSRHKSKQRSGVHFTPPFIARTVVEQALSSSICQKPKLVVFDPACGSGEFLREVLRQLSIRSYKGLVELIGYEISQGACDLAQFVLSNEVKACEFEVTFTIKRCNSLGANNQWPDNVDLLVMNPPFVSWEDLDDEQKQSVKSTLGKIAKQRTDLSHAFLFKAIDTLVNGGQLASIIPATFFDSQAASTLRQEFMDKCPPHFIARLGNHSLFASAIVDPAFFIATKNGMLNETLCTWSDHRPESASSSLRKLRMLGESQDIPLPIIEDGFNIYIQNDGSRLSKGWSPKPYDAIELNTRYSVLPRSKDIFEIRQGVITGLNEAFIISKESYFELPKEEQVYFKPAITNDAINFGFLDCVKYLFYPHGASEINSEIELFEKVPEYAQSHLTKFKDRLSNRKRIPVEKWFSLTEHRRWQRTNSQKIVSTYFGKPGSFAYDKSGEYAVVQGYAWFPKFNLPVTENLMIAYLAILNSHFYFKLLSATSNPVAGGQLNLSRRYVNPIPLPDLSKFSGGLIIDQLIELGTRMTKGMSYDFDHLESAVKKVYG